MFQRKDYNYFSNFYIPGLILILFSLFSGRGNNLLKLLLVFGVPLVTLPFLFKKIGIEKIEEKSEEEQEKKVKIIATIILLEIFFVGGILFLGIPILPFFVAPFNNLYLYGVFFTMIIIYYFKKHKISKGSGLLLMLFTWSSIFLYQVILKYFI